MSTLSYSQLKSANEARLSEEARQEQLTRNILLLILHHLTDEGYRESATVLEKESGLSLSRYQICDNIDLNTILLEYEAYYRIKFNKQPKISKKIPSQGSTDDNSSSQAKPSNRRNLTSRLTTLPKIAQEVTTENSPYVPPPPSNYTIHAYTKQASTGIPRNSRNSMRNKACNEQQQDNQLIAADFGLTSTQMNNNSNNNSSSKSNDRTKNCPHQILNVRDLLNSAIHDGEPLKGVPVPPVALSTQISNQNSDKIHKPIGALTACYSSEMRDLAAVISRDIYLQNPDVHWDDIVGLDTAKQLIKEAVVYPIKYPELFKGILSPWKGLLLFGPPGTGKTMLAKAVATECCTTFFNISASSIVSKWRGDSEKLVRVLFELARFHAPSTIFLDELESIMGQRGSIGGVGGSEHEGSRRMKTELLVQMDGLAKSDDLVFLLAASNLPWELDKSMLRRLEKRIMVGLPTEDAREAMIRYFLPPVVSPPPVLIKSDVDYRSLAQKTEGYSGSDLRLVCKEAVMMRLRKVFAQLESLAEDDSDRGLKHLQVEPVLSEDVETALIRTKSSAHNMTESYLKWQIEYQSV